MRILRKSNFRGIPMFMIRLESGENVSDFGYHEWAFDVYHLASLCIPEHKVEEYQQAQDKLNRELKGVDLLGVGRL